MNIIPARHTVWAFAAMLLLVLGTAPVAAEEHAHHHAEGHELSLNDGRKWIADAHTFESAQTMKTLVAMLPDTATAEDLRTLGEQIHEELQGLIRGCTMDGAAHDQLHTWIEGLSPDLQSLMKTEDVTQGQAALAHVAHHLEAFDKHFQKESVTP